MPEQINEGDELSFNITIAPDRNWRNTPSGMGLITRELAVITKPQRGVQIQEADNLYNNVNFQRSLANLLRLLGAEDGSGQLLLQDACFLALKVWSQTIKTENC